MKEYGAIDGIAITNVDFDTEENVVTLYSGENAIAQGTEIRLNERAIRNLKKKQIRRGKIKGFLGKVGAGVGIAALISLIAACLVMIKDIKEDYHDQYLSELETGKSIVMEMVKTSDGQQIVAEYLDDVLGDISTKIDEAKGYDDTGLRLLETKLDKAISEAAVAKQNAIEAEEVGEDKLAEQNKIDYAGKLMAAAFDAAESGMIIGVGPYEGYKDAKIIDGRLYMAIDTQNLVNGMLPKGSILIDNILYAPASQIEQSKSLS